MGFRHAKKEVLETTTLSLLYLRLSFVFYLYASDFHAESNFKIGFSWIILIQTIFWNLLF